MGEVSHEAADRAAQAVINAGRSWEDFKRAVQSVQASRLTPRTIACLIADECDLPSDVVEAVLPTFPKLPSLIAVAA